MIFFLYNLIILILLPLIFVRLLLRSLKDADYRKNLMHRIGVYGSLNNKNSVWFHAVSLGEVISSENLINKILDKNKVILSVSTPTGFRQAKKIFKNRLEVVYAPWDFYFFVNNFIRNFKPKALIIFETEIWPSMIKNSSALGLPIILANARLSKDSNDKYFQMKFFLKNVLNKFTLILAQSKNHVDRFHKLGVNLDKIKEVGSLKFDKNENQENFELIHKDKSLIIATSTHEGEEEIICKVFSRLMEKKASLRSVLIPRHPERSESLSKMLTKKGIKNIVVNRIPETFKNGEITIIKGIGFLNNLYSMANVAFIGGSLLKEYGGHNIIEASSNKCSFIVGPYMKNFEDIMEQYINNKACIQIKHASELYDALYKLISDDDFRENMVDNGIKLIENNKGSLEKQYNYIKTYL